MPGTGTLRAEYTTLAGHAPARGFKLHNGVSWLDEVEGGFRRSAWRLPMIRPLASGCTRRRLFTVHTGDSQQNSPQINCAAAGRGLTWTAGPGLLTPTNAHSTPTTCLLAPVPSFASHIRSLTNVYCLLPTAYSLQPTPPQPPPVSSQVL